MTALAYTGPMAPQVTEADVRLLPTAVRFDGVYASFFRCGRKQIRSDYPNVERWVSTPPKSRRGIGW